jgi:hypothetical protein
MVTKTEKFDVAIFPSKSYFTSLLHAQNTLCFGKMFRKQPLILYCDLSVDERKRQKKVSMQQFMLYQGCNNLRQNIFRNLVLTLLSSAPFSVWSSISAILQ